MIRLLFLFLIAIFLARFILRNFLSSTPAKKKEPQLKKNVEELEFKNSVETLAPCPVCGTYFRSSQGFTRDYRLYCSLDCLEKSSLRP